MTEKTNPLQPIAQALSVEDFAFIERRALEISATLDGRNVRRNAEVYPGVTPHWHVVTVLPGQERTAADELSERAFGVYLPESEHTEVRRGRKVDLKRLLLPGYVFAFVWDVDRHLDRIRACDGVRGLLFMNGQALIVPDSDIDRVRVRENAYRPLKGLVMEHEATNTKRAKRCWRKTRKPELATLEEQGNDIINVHSYSPFIEELRKQSEADAQLGPFHRALRRALNLPAESA